MEKCGSFISGNNELSYSCVIPSGKTADTGVVFVHAAGGNRLGPHRIFVELAARFNSLGLPTFRFDLTGCGDSTGTASENDTAADVSVILEAVKFFIADANLGSVILLGISRGSFLCYNIMTQHSVALRAMILLSTPASVHASSLKSFGGRLKEYICKLSEPAHLRKLLSGKANVRQILKTLTVAFQFGNRYRPAQKKYFASKCPVLLIYGGNDHIAAESSRYYGARLRENNLPFSIHIIEGANHSFFHYRWTEEIIDVSSQWLEKILKGTVDD